MKRVSFLAVPAIAVSVYVIVGQQPSPAAQTGTVRGIVVRAGPQDPIKDVQVVVGNAGGRATPAPARAAAPAATPSTLSAVSDSAGRFIINDVPLGQQVLTAKRDGYFGISTHDIPPAAATATVTVSPQNPVEVSIAMVPGSAVSGKITESTGLPAVEVPVEIFRIGYKTATADNQGGFKLDAIAPGTYKLFAWPDIPAGGAYQNAEFLRQFEEKGVLISVTSGANITQQLPVIR